MRTLAESAGRVAEMMGAGGGKEPHDVDRAMSELGVGGAEFAPTCEEHVAAIIAAHQASIDVIPELQLTVPELLESSLTYGFLLGAAFAGR
jgi:hypothetical protein